MIRAKQAKISLRKVVKIYRCLYGRGKVGRGQSLSPPPPHHTNGCQISRLWEAVSSLVFNKSLSNLVILLVVRHSFHGCRRIYPTLVHVKSWKKQWKGLLKEHRKVTLREKLVPNLPNSKKIFFKTNHILSTFLTLWVVNKMMASMGYINSLRKQPTFCDATGRVSPRNNIWRRFPFFQNWPAGPVS